MVIPINITPWDYCWVDKHSITGWWYTYPSENYEFVSCDDYSQYMEKSSKPCSKPPTRLNPIQWPLRVSAQRCLHQNFAVGQRVALSIVTDWEHGNYGDFSQRFMEVDPRQNLHFGWFLLGFTTLITHYEAEIDILDMGREELGKLRIFVYI